jgi:hypothetical protein
VNSSDNLDGTDDSCALISLILYCFYALIVEFRRSCHGGRRQQIAKCMDSARADKMKILRCDVGNEGVKL